MIPVSLSLKNFMSYGDPGQTLSFEGLHVACLCGDNGNGKSALLDAMTWALWGKTRGSNTQSVTDDDLIRRSADEMEVRFEFELNEQKYRVIRKRKRGKPGDWQFAQALDSGQYAAIAGGGTREVGRQISQLLSMEYETFLASAYLQQGHADEFTRQKPAQRKQILGEILGLAQYDRLEAMARERSRDLKMSIGDLEGQIRVLEAQVARRAEYDEDLIAVRTATAELESAHATQAAAAEVCREQRIRLEQAAQRRDAMVGEERQMHAELRAAEAACESQRTRLADLNELISQRESILKDNEALLAARRKREELEPQIEQFNRKTAELQSVTGAIEVERARLQGEERTLCQQASAAARQAAELERIVSLITEIAAEQEKEKSLLQEFEAAQNNFDLARERFEALKARNVKLNEELKEHAEVLEILNRPQSVCPVCESDLAGTKRDRVVARQGAKHADLVAEQSRVQKEGTVSKREVESMRAVLSDLQTRRDQFTARKSRLEELMRSRESLASAPMDLERAQAQATAIQKLLESEDFAQVKRLQKARIQQELDRLGTGKTEYEAVAVRARALTGADMRRDRLRDAEEQLPAEQSELERRAGLAASKQKALALHREAIAALQVELTALEGVRAQATKAESELARLSTELASIRRREGALLGFIDDCERAAKISKEKEADRKRIHQEQWTYEKLAACFGKKGIQALIIENAIPELEEEANDLLSRMTDNGMQVRFLTTRAGKTTKSEIETLDISITDDEGPRPYEMFSGGEAFRVNFAIRIALSRLLAGRSGARLQTLILDEGFGTQDGKGREKLVEAIDAIKGDFRKIIVITHVEELKDAFSQRIEVSKDGKGSKIYVY